MSQRIIFAAALVTMMANQGNAAPLLCRIDHKFACNSQGCRPVFPDRSYNQIDPERGTFTRCDDKGCDEYPANFTRSGLFTNIEIAPDALAKLSYIREDPFVPVQAQLLEVVTTGLVVLVSYASCSEATP